MAKTRQQREDYALPLSMDVPLTNDEYEKLLFVEACLRTQKHMRFSEEDVSLLQARGLLVQFGMSTDITPKGRKALLDLRQGF